MLIKSVEEHKNGWLAWID